MYHTAVRMLGNRADAEDVLQEVFMRVFDQLEAFRGDATLGAWIKRITINTALNHLRRKNQIRWRELPETPEIALLPQEAAAVEEVDVGRIHRAIKALPEGCRVIFNLHALEGYQHQEIAQILDISASTSKSQYRRARLMLQQKLSNEFKVNGL